MAAVDCTQQWADDAIPSAAQGPECQITPEYVNSLAAPADRFLCPLSANIYNIDFVNFKIRSMDEGSEKLLLEVRQSEAENAALPEGDSSRSIRYEFGPDFLDIKNIGTTVEFTVGDQPLRDFRMIERHYFRNQLIANFDFTMPFVIPGTRNTWEMMYAKPELSDEWKAALIANPWESRSDSFYFVEGRLVMHNKAEYSYATR